MKCQMGARAGEGLLETSKRRTYMLLFRKAAGDNVKTHRIGRISLGCPVSEVIPFPLTIFSFSSLIKN
jgi:hypothetical protein